ncbi:DNA processing protein DprA [Pseudomonas aeruginosa]|nr:DNA-protecting protein DprA [Pseudomonas aeruginosa]MZY43578.1 DNA-processing protein DprA [Pseudomonas aeruginosa]RPX01818.1 DNA processing protein DprA [Pseudomonas aeruginosa]HBP6263536.1 DNA-processing protein DprA [Pseudomonas aeruginosa]HCF1957996.1 DNA-protecting protein DprA [Pseudomonas aeruginosa]
MLGGVGPATLKKVASVEKFEELPVEELARKFPALAKSLVPPDAWNLALEKTNQQLVAAEKHDAWIVSAVDDGYPCLLSMTKDDPFILFVRGRLHSRPEKSVAVIGTRHPTAHGEIITRRITDYFVNESWSIVSGLALGCDGLAHRAAVDARGHTVAVLAHGLQTIAPSQHRKLAEEILESGGALVSEFPFGQGVFPQQFVKRDRTQAGMAQGVVMIQSDIKGGSLHASRAALDYSRWLAVPLPTSTDRGNQETKVQANILIAEGEWVERAELLKCHRSKLDLILVLKAKEDYPSMISASNISCPVVLCSDVDEVGRVEGMSALELELPLSEEGAFPGANSDGSKDLLPDVVAGDVKPSEPRETKDASLLDKIGDADRGEEKDNPSGSLTHQHRLL